MSTCHEFACLLASRHPNITLSYVWSLCQTSGIHTYCVSDSFFTRVMNAAHITVVSCPFYVQRIYISLLQLFYDQYQTA